MVTKKMCKNTVLVKCNIVEIIFPEQFNGFLIGLENSIVYLEEMPLNNFCKIKLELMRLPRK